MQFFLRARMDRIFFSMIKLQDIFSSNGAWFLSFARFFLNVVFLWKIFFPLVKDLFEYFLVFAQPPPPLKNLMVRPYTFFTKVTISEIGQIHGFRMLRIILHVSVIFRFFMYYLIYEQECFIRYKTRGAAKRIISDKARIARIY